MSLFSCCCPAARSGRSREAHTTHEQDPATPHEPDPATPRERDPATPREQHPTTPYEQDPTTPHRLQHDHFRDIDYGMHNDTAPANHYYGGEALSSTPRVSPRTTVVGTQDASSSVYSREADDGMSTEARSAPTDAVRSNQRGEKANSGTGDNSDEERLAEAAHVASMKQMLGKIKEARTTEGM